jgi:NADH-quinone oxidoreductase subunit N
MPLPAAPLLLLTVAGMALILSRWVSTSRWYEGIWLAAMLGSAGLLISGEFPLKASAGHPAIWSADPLAVAGQSLALMFGFVFGIGSFGIRSVDDRTAERFGYLSCLIAGVMLVATSSDLITMALSVEIVQFAAWSLRRLDRMEKTARTSRSHLQDRDPLGDSVVGEDGPVVWSGISTSICLWLGIALLANLTGSTQFDEIRHVLADAYVPGVGRAVIGAGSKLGLLAIGLIVTGLASRMGLVPWQLGFIEGTRHGGYWTTGCVLLGGQLAGVLGLARLCGTVWMGYRDEILVLLLVVAAATCAVSGVLAALGLMNGEGRLRRWVASFPMLHAAWLTIGLIAATADLAIPEHGLSAAGGQPGALALLIFASGAGLLGLAGLFLLLSYLSHDDRDVEFIDELTGLSRLRPLPSAALMVLLGSLIGQPPLGGFWAYWLMMIAGLNVRAAGARENALPHAGLILLLIMAAAATLISACVVIRFARIVLLEQPIAQSVPRGRRAALVTGCGCAFVLVAVGFFPGRVLSVLSDVRGQQTRSGSDSPSGSSRGDATATRSRHDGPQARSAASAPRT